MPQMGESVAEGTIVRWLKQVGDRVERDEPLFEISTDKVDAEIPSPAAGFLVEIRHKEGETVDVNAVVAVIGETASQPAVAAAPAAASAVATPAVASSTPAAPSPAPASEDVEGGRVRTSPLVRRIAKEHHVDLSNLTGTGIGGRVTKSDILAFVEKPVARPAAPAAFKGSGVSAGVGLAGQTVPMSVMRKKIAEHMVFSKETSAHVHTVFEVSFAQVEKIRQARKAEFERQGVKLTYLAFIIKAVADALKVVPVVNASADGDRIVYHQDVNVGVAVALDWGLIVPVVKNADRMSLLDVSKAIVDLAARAREKKLKPEDVAGGTFTITNPGMIGALFGTPIINQPQVAILAVGAIEKRPVVIDDAIAIRHMAYFCLGFDHRIIDGATADEFMALVKKTLEAGAF
jgi:2-oxoglutarate dehydrogenase E2 component (dihydrolipoamide succinyltransferase)